MSRKKEKREKVSVNNGQLNALTNISNSILLLCLYLILWGQSSKSSQPADGVCKYCSLLPSVVLAVQTSMSISVQHTEHWGWDVYLDAGMSTKTFSLHGGGSDAQTVEVHPKRSNDILALWRMSMMTAMGREHYQPEMDTEPLPWGKCPIPVIDMYCTPKH